MQFVVRLHDRIHDDMSDIPPGIAIQTVTGRQALALSTYFHEKIHWWQHVGSSLGLLLSLAYPAQTHVNVTRLKTILRDVGGVKSLRTFHRLNPRPLTHATNEVLNIILNNWHDIEYCRRLALVPELIEAAARDPYFESLGHAYTITWGNGVLLIGDALDPNRSFIPNPYEWDEPTDQLRKDRVEDYYYGSPVRLSRLGARLIFEGQARFAQLQQLHFNSPETADWKLFDALGMLQDDYTAAFRAFLAAAGRPWPGSAGGPEVGLFLVICDIAINPTEGFPFPVTDFAGWRKNLDPGIRFHRLCVAAAANPHLFETVKHFTRAEYEVVAETLAHALSWPTPLEACARVRSWDQHASFRALEAEDAAFAFVNKDLPVRVFVARFLEFQKDKLRYPELFVWPGVFASSRERHLPIETVIEVLTRHEPLFVAAPDGEIRPTLLIGRDSRAIYDTFNSFYAYTAAYQLVRQWHIVDGSFDFDFGWLVPHASQELIQDWAKTIFKNAFGTSVDDFELLLHPNAQEL